jgi:acyl-coenzyme A synthetase/AMP-(fatty) acid ligase
VNLNNVNISTTNEPLKIIKCDDLQPDSPALIAFSSGTTGEHKIIVLSQKTIFFFVRPDHLIYKQQAI